MTKKKPDIYEEHQQAIRDFEARGEPEVWVCFFWPALHEWQAIAADNRFEENVDDLVTMMTEARRQQDSSYSPTIKDVVADATNGLAEMVLDKVNNVILMSTLLLLLKRETGHRYLFVTVDRSVVRDGKEGSVATITPIVATTMQQARDWVDAHPGIEAAKVAQLDRLLTQKRH